MADKVPTIKLNSGYGMPILGLGTYVNLKRNELGDPLKAAILMGYRHFDTAFSYENEGEIGDTIQQMIKDGQVKREELFITTKLWGDGHEPDKVEAKCRQSLDALKMDYVDLYLIHFPIGYTDYERTQTTNRDYLDTWKIMETLVDKGLAKSIGVSNFNKQQLQRILKMDGLKYPPANNQVEITPFLANDDLLQFSFTNGISTTAYGPFGGLGQNYIPADAPKFLENPKIVAIGKKYGKSPAQVILRWGVQRGYAIVPKSTNPARQAQNMDIFDFELSADDIKDMMSLDRGYRVNPFLKWKDHQFYPFKE